MDNAYGEVGLCGCNFSFLNLKNKLWYQMHKCKLTAPSTLPPSLLQGTRGTYKM